jgi:hypothetical protein
MATPLQTVYDAFMARILEDDWNVQPNEDGSAPDWVIQDQRLILEAALPWFKFPRVSLEHDDTRFSGDLG